VPLTPSQKNQSTLTPQFYITWQTRGLQMLREAYHWTAMQRYSERLNATIIAQCNSTLTPACAVWTSDNLPSTPEGLCSIAVNLPQDSKSPVAAAKSVRWSVDHAGLGPRVLARLLGRGTLKKSMER
jgi:hypothetical protein